MFKPCGSKNIFSDIGCQGSNKEDEETLWNASESENFSRRQSIKNTVTQELYLETNEQCKYDNFFKDKKKEVILFEESFLDSQKCQSSVSAVAKSTTASERKQQPVIRHF